MEECEVTIDDRDCPSENSTQKYGERDLVDQKRDPIDRNCILIH